MPALAGASLRIGVLFAAWAMARSESMESLEIIDLEPIS